jgi:hypothetical protein
LCSTLPPAGPGRLGTLGGIAPLWRGRQAVAWNTKIASDGMDDQPFMVGTGSGQTD